MTEDDWFLRDITNEGTHRPVLLTAIRETSGPVLELGVGMSSTRQLHDLCRGLGRHLVSVEDNKEWFAKFQHLHDDCHELMLVASYAQAPIERQHWGVIFIDHWPGRKRQVEVQRAAAWAEVVVVHDTEPANALHYGYDLGQYTYRKDYTEFDAHAVALSQTMDVTQWRWPTPSSSAGPDPA